MKFLKDIKCDGGDDGAEDLRGGIKQMVKNLPWEKSFKIALLVCDAPSHG
jgi:myosin protein heavy chain